MKSGLPPFPDLPDEVRRDSGLYVIYPYCLIGTHADRIHWTTLIPVAPNRTTWVRHVLVQPEAADLPDLPEIVARMRETGKRIADEDLEVNGMQQYGAASSYAEIGRLSHLESAVWQLSDYVRARIGA